MCGFERQFEDSKGYQYLANGLNSLFRKCGLLKQDSRILVFAEQLQRDLEYMAKGKAISNSYTFSIISRAENESYSVCFVIEPDFIEISSGGSIYTPTIGTDSYTDQTYVMGENSLDSLDALICKAVSCAQSGTRFIIEWPEEFAAEIEIRP